MYGPKWPFLLMYVFCDTRRTDFPQVDGLSTDTPVLGRHNYSYGIIFLESSSIVMLQIPSIDH